MKLVDMKRSKKDSRKASKVSMHPDPYSYGLRVELDSEALDKLGLSLPKVGAEFMLHAAVCVSSVHSNASADHESKSVGLQIKRMALEKRNKTTRDAVDAGIKEANS